MAQKTVTGTVSDAEGPLPGAAVVVQGASGGVTTDFDGNYSIEANEGDILEFTFIGMTSGTATVGSDSVVNITLEGGDNTLEEVVVIGYSTQTRGDITGSVASVDMDEALKAPVVNAAEALQGRVTGVTVIQNNQPGSTPKINIRGFGTANNTDPLFIIDGVQTDDAQVLNNINASDIDQMNVLKDGAAAIYGARAANGVVIITTKSGSYNQNKATFSFDAYTGFSEVSNAPSLLNPTQHAEMLRQSMVNDGSAPSHGQYDPSGSGTFTVPTSIVGYTRVQSYDPITYYPVGEKSAAVNPGGTNWINALTQTAPTSNVSFSLSNGNENGKYFMSVGYLNRDGILNETGFERISTKLNSEFKIGEKLTIGEHINISYSNTRSGNGEAMEMALRMTPLLPVYDDEGGPNSFAGVAGPSLGNTRNPVALNYRTRDNYNKRYAVFGDAYLAYDIIDGLTFKTTLAFGFNTFDSRSFTALDPEHGEPISNNSLNEQDQTGYNWGWTNTLQYNNSWGDHDLNALVGVEALKYSEKGKGITRAGYLFEDPDFYLLNNGTELPNVDYAYDGYNTLYSLFATANYNYKGKYFASATVRQDESSRFLGDNKSDIFPSFSAGWVMSNEDFFNSTGVVNRLKLKASWGQLGNQTLPADNPTINISNLNESQANYAFDGSSITTGALLSQVGNPDLKWETSVTSNLGIELDMFSSKLNVAFEVYQIKTEDLITRDFGLISTTAIDAGAPLVNLGDMKNTGFDLSIGYSNTYDSGFSWGINGNFSMYKNEVTALIGDTPVGGTTSALRGQQPTRTEVGDEISFFYGRNVIGFTDTGRFEYEDVSGPDGTPDGVIDDNDRTKIGSPHPDFTYGINLTAAYKNFDLSAFFTGSQGNDIYNFNKFYTDFPAFVNGNRSTRVLDAWTPDNTDGKVPALSTSITNNEGDPNSYYVEDGSFFRLKNLQIGYSLPQTLMDKWNMSAIRFYMQGTNLFTITDYSGFDPEIISYDNLSLGIDGRIYPASKVYTLGVNVKF